MRRDGLFVSPGLAHLPSILALIDFSFTISIRLLANKATALSAGLTSCVNLLSPLEVLANGILDVSECGRSSPSGVVAGPQ